MLCLHTDAIMRSDGFFIFQNFYSMEIGTRHVSIVLGMVARQVLGPFCIHYFPKIDRPMSDQCSEMIVNFPC